MTNKCFMMQPFDDGKYDSRYRETYKPAIENAGFLPYRVDQDPAVEIPIDDIEKGIRESSICLAEISTDNPNVWFELGYAIAAHKPVVLVCSSERTKFPFDVQHRTIIRYESNSKSDFEKLEGQITEKLVSISKRLIKQEELRIESVTKPRSGLSDHQIACLVSIASEIEGSNSTLYSGRIRELMSRSGYNGLGTNVALRSLQQIGYVEFNMESDFNSGNAYEVYCITDSGWEWIEENVDNLNINEDSKSRNSNDFVRDDDEIPF